jgi:hypothetical protein
MNSPIRIGAQLYCMRSRFLHYSPAQLQNCTPLDRKPAENDWKQCSKSIYTIGAVGRGHRRAAIKLKPA